MRAAVIYATRQGQTRRIAEHIAAQLRLRYVDVDVRNVKDDPIVDWSRYGVVCVAASVHIGRHEPEMTTFVRQNRTHLERLDAAFLSVSLSEAGAENTTAPPERRRESAADVDRMIDKFIEDTGWKPEHTLAVAGALAYSRYNVVVRFLMKQVARQAGASTDTSRDHEFTDWHTVDRFVDDLVPSSGRQP